MPSVSKNELLQVVREVWGFPGAPTDDQAKMALAEALIREAWEQGNKYGAWPHSCTPMSRSGQPPGLLPVCSSCTQASSQPCAARPASQQSNHWLAALL
jgi:hypothetical protein